MHLIRRDRIGTCSNFVIKEELNLRQDYEIDS